MDKKSKFNNIVYDFLKSHYYIFYTKKNVQKRLERIEKLAFFLFTHFSFYLADFELEEELKIIAFQEFPDFEFPLIKKPNDQKKILHIATELYDVGGHTRVIKNWIEEDVECKSHLLLTCQKKELKTNIIEELEEKMAQSTLILNSSKNHIQKAHDVIYFIVKNDINIVVLHTHPYDIVPFLSLSFKNAPKIILFNHSDHTFCLGAKEVNLMFEFRDEGKRLSYEHRGVNNAITVGLPTKKLLPKKKPSKNKEDSIVFVSMASWYKYKPFEGQNFFLRYTDFLQRHPDVKMYIIGVSEEHYKKHIKEQIPNNLFLLGVLPNPEEYLKKAHYYIESFPVGSILAAYDSCVYGATPIFSYDSILVYKEALKKMFPPFNFDAEYKDESEYFKFIEEEVKTGKYRSENKPIIQKFLKERNGEKWVAALSDSLKKIPEKTQSSISKNKLIINEQSKKYARFTSCFSKFQFVDYINSRLELLHPLLISKYIRVVIVKFQLKKHG